MSVLRFPVMTIDGPSGSGKGTIAQLVALRLGWHYFDSGAIYRVLALASRQHQLSPDDETQLADLATHLVLEFQTEEGGKAPKVILEGEEVTEAIRHSDIGQLASTISVSPMVRQALLERQRAFCQAPGLVTDGRDMGTVVFPDAKCKIFLTASLEERAKRRYLQLKNQGFNDSLGRVITGLAERDERDTNRSVSPLKPADDAVQIDTTGLTIEQVVDLVIDEAHKRLPS